VMSQDIGDGRTHDWVRFRRVVGRSRVVLPKSITCRLARAGLSSVPQLSCGTDRVDAGLQ